MRDRTLTPSLFDCVCFDKEYHEIISLDYEENIIAPSPGNCLHAFIM